MPSELPSTPDVLLAAASAPTNVDCTVALNPDGSWPVGLWLAGPDDPAPVGYVRVENYASLLRAAAQARGALLALPLPTQATLLAGAALDAEILAALNGLGMEDTP